MKKTTVLYASMLTATLLQTAGARADDAAPAAPAPAEKPVVLAHDDFKEPGRFGVVGAVTEDGFQFGVARIDEHFEVVTTVDASFAALGSSTALTGADGDMGITLRLGPRFALGHLNYLSLGAQGHLSVFGKNDGVSTFPSWAAGPYIGVHRNFAGTPLMISMWVLPYEFQHELQNDGSGNQVSVDTHHFFQAGGFGLAYLF